jgi:DNA replication protein DnaC
MARALEAFTEQAGRDGWSHEQYLRALCDVEVSRRAERRRERLLKESRLPDGKTLATLEQQRLPLRVRRQLSALLEGRFVEQADNVLAFGLPGRGKTHLCCAVARELIVAKGYRALFCPAVHLVQQLLIAKRDLRLEAVLRKLDGYDIVVLDDIGYIQQSREEMEVLFTFLAERYERKSLMITSNLVFSEWDKIFKDPMTTAAAIDRLVHHAIILELDGDSYRMQHAKTNKQKGGD